MIRILQLVHHLGMGGVQKTLVEQFRHLNRARFQMDFLVEREEPGGFYEELRTLGGRIFVGWPASSPFRQVRRFKQVVHEQGPYQVVHCHFMGFGLLVKVAAGLGIPIRIVHCHSDIRQRKQRRLLDHLYLRGLLHVSRWYSTHRLAVSPMAAESYFGRDWQQDPSCQLIFPCRDYSVFRVPVDRAAVHAEFALPVDAFVVGHVGRLCEPKNHRFLVRIAAELARVEPRTHFLLVGGGPLEPELRAAVTVAGLEARVHFAGMRSDVPRLLGACDRFVLPSLYEGLPSALIEAQAAGLFCVFSDVIANEAAIVSELTRPLPLAASPAAWAAAILAGPAPGCVLSQAEALARIEASPFAVQQSMRQLEAIYSDSGGRDQPVRPVREHGDTQAG